ncbi:hypothetical protein X777_09074, partial [Ooceraea biroi]
GGRKVPCVWLPSWTELGDFSGKWSRKGTSPIKAMGIMDTWKRGRIIYAYLIWVVFKATTAGGLYGEYISVR